LLRPQGVKLEAWMPEVPRAEVELWGGPATGPGERSPAAKVLHVYCWFCFHFCRVYVFAFFLCFWCYQLLIN